MKRYHIYGIGNALVDIVFNVDQPFLEKHSIEKGVMTLVDEARQNYLMDEVNQLSPTLSCGGSAANTIIGSQQLGLKNFYSYQVASDYFGEFYSKDLTSHGVSVPSNNHAIQGHTGKCMVMVTPDADRTMNTFLGATLLFNEALIDWEALAQSEWLYVEGYLLAQESAYEACLKIIPFARENGVKISFSLSDPFIVQVFKERVEKIISLGIDFVFCNLSEAKELTNAQNTHLVEESLKKMVGAYAITLGDQGALSGDKHTSFRVSAKKVTAIDTNGAGDAFAGAFLFGLCQNFSLEKCAQMGVVLASEVVSQVGPRLSNEKINLLIENGSFK